MKNWWLDLYTIPGLKLLGRSFLFVLIPTLLLVFLLPDMLFIMFYGSFYIAYCSKKASAKSFSANIEFHKLHVPFEELRKALIKDSLIQGVFYFLAYFTIWMLTDLFDPADLGDFKYTILLIYFAASFGTYYKIAGIKQPGVFMYEWLDGKKHNVLSLIIYMGLGFFGIMFLGLLKLSGFEPITAFFLVGLTVVFGYTWFLTKAVFHQEVKKGSPKVFFKYLFKGSGAATLACLLLMLVTRPLITMVSVDPELRHLAFAFAGPLAPELEIVDAKDLLSVDDPAISMIFRKTPGLEQVPVSEIWTKPNSSNFIDYLTYVKDPSVANMTYMLNAISAKKKHSHFDQAAAQLIVRKWPKNEKFPEHLLAKKMKKEEVPKEERLPASSEQEE